MKKMKKAVENRRDSIVKLIPKQHNNNNDIIKIIKEGKFLCILLNYCFRKFKTR